MRNYEKIDVKGHGHVSRWTDGPMRWYAFREDAHEAKSFGRSCLCTDKGDLRWFPSPIEAAQALKEPNLTIREYLKGKRHGDK